MRRAEAQECWYSRVSELCVIAKYVAKRLAAYFWPSALELRPQYRDLMMHWGRLCAREDVQKACLGPASAQAASEAFAESRPKFHARLRARARGACDCVRMETMFHLRCGVPLWLLSGCLTLCALSAKACDELKLRSFGPHVPVSFVSLLSMWPSMWQHTLGHLPSSCGPNTGI